MHICHLNRIFSDCYFRLLRQFSPARITPPMLDTHLHPSSILIRTSGRSLGPSNKAVLFRISLSSGQKTVSHFLFPYFEVPTQRISPKGTDMFKVSGAIPAERQSLCSFSCLVCAVQVFSQLFPACGCAIDIFL